MDIFGILIQTGRVEESSLGRRWAESGAQIASKGGCSDMNSRKKSQTAFTLFEAMIGISIIAVLSSLGYAAMSTCGKSAVTARLHTLATEMARDQIDQIESASPYNPQNNPTQIPTILAIGTTTTTPPLYVDPATGSTVISATLQTVISDAGSYNARSASVTVSYTYCGKSYSVQMSTIRISDL
jgi:type II secretory pathway pseudopilin PulG